MPEPTRRHGADLIVADYAVAVAVDARRPEAEGRTRRYLAGIGPFGEAAAVKLVVQELVRLWPERYERHDLNVPYPELRRQRCDLCLGDPADRSWAIEVKVLRLLGDNGKLNDSMLMHILSPYPEDRSAVTDCAKLSSSRLGQRKMVLIYAFDADGYPTEVAISALERLAAGVARLGPRAEASFDGLVHPVHQRGSVFGWELLAR